MSSSPRNAEKGYAPGEKFNRYTIVRRIGEGGMAIVYEAIHTDLQKRVALKTMVPWFALRTDIIQRFMIEGRAASRLAHPHVVSIHDIGVENDIPFMAMDLLDGADLSTILGRSGPLPPERLADIFLPVLSALAAAHKTGILHRDLKPENIFIARRAPVGDHPVLLDFGLSKFDAGSPLKSLTASGELVGTPPFMAPEQVIGGMDMYTARSDQYAVAIAIYECATGVLPYDDPDMQALLVKISRGGAMPLSRRRPSIPEAFSEVIQRAMSLAPDDRYASARAFGRALLPFAGPIARALWSTEFAEKLGSKTTMDVVPFRVDDLRVVPSLKAIPAVELGRAAATGEITQAKSGTSLFIQGTPGASCFILLSGAVELTRTHGASTWHIAKIGPGLILGLSALWDDGPRPVSATTVDDCIVVEISREAFAQFDALCPSVADAILNEAIAKALDRTDRGGRHLAHALRSTQPPPSADAAIMLAASMREWSFPAPG